MSPLSTGGAGPDFETKVGAIYLSALLTGAPIRGAKGGAATQVRFQQAHANAPLDDMTVETKGRYGVLPYHLQLKRSFTFARSDREFEPVLRTCWATARQPAFRNPGARFGVAIENFPVRLKEHYARVPEWARTSTSASDFFSRINTVGLASAHMREFAGRVTDYLRQYDPAESSEEALWEFFARLVILDFDVELEGSRDIHAAVMLLRSAVPGGNVEAAQELFRRLCTAVRSPSNTAGGYSVQSLREHLLAEGADLVEPQSISADVERLADWGDRAFEEINSSIGGVQVDRGTATAEVLDALDQGTIIVIAGPGGAGKSALLKTVASVRRQDGFVFALSRERLSGIVGWEGLSQRLQLLRSREEIVLGLSGTGRPTLVIDGADRIGEEGARLAVKDMLRALEKVPPGPNGRERWNIVVTTRAETLEEVRDWMGLPGKLTKVVTVSYLTDDEIEALMGRLPHLGNVLSRPELGPVVRNPYFLNVLEEVRADSKEFRMLAPVTEAAVHQIWWDRLVGRTGARGRARQQSLITLGRSALAARRRQLLADSIDPEVVHSLELDGILRRDPATDTFWFGHDIIEEWTSARVLAQESTNLLAYLHSIGEPFWAFRALQLFACSILEGKDGDVRWSELLATTEADPTAELRWTEGVLTAPLRSARLADLLPRIEHHLLQHEGARLKGFLRAVRTQAITPHPSYVALLSQQPLSAEEQATLALELAWPDVVVWAPVLDWLIPRINELPGGLREELSRLMMIWQRATAPGVPFRREIAEVALEWYGILDHPSGEHVVVERGAEPYFNRLRDIVASSADAIPERMREFLDRVRRVEPDHELFRWIARSPQISLIHHTPALFVDFVLDLLAPGWRDPATLIGSEQVRRTSHGDMDLDWPHPYSDTAFLNPSHLRGPFLALLNTHEREGLRLVHSLVHWAVERWAASDRCCDLSVTLRVGEEDRDFRGDGEVYRWFRPMSNGPWVVTSALMALEVWMELQIESDRDPVELFRIVLADATSVAEVAVCVAISLAYPAQCIHAAVPFVTNPRLWDFDIDRFELDRYGTTSFGGLFGPGPAEQAALQRDDRPQRKTDLRSLVPHYLFNERLSNLRTQVLEAICTFPEHLYLLTAEERDDPAAVAAFQRHMEHHVALTDPENYRFYQNPDGSFAGIGYEVPTKLREREAAAIEHSERTTRYHRLQNWASDSLKKAVAASGLTVEEAVAEARELQRPDDFAEPITMDGDFDYVRLQGIAGVAAAAVLVNPRWVQSSGTLQWCIDVLMKGAMAPRSTDPLLRGIRSHDVALSSAQGLMQLILLKLADQPCRLTAFHLLRASSQVAEVVMTRVREVWDQDPVFSRNAVARELALAISPHRQHHWEPVQRKADEVEERTRVEAIEAHFENNIREGRVPEIRFKPPGERDQVWMGRIERVLRAIPLEKISEGHENELALAVTDVLMARFTASAVAHPRSRLSYEQGHQWVSFFGDWLAVLAGVLSEPQFKAPVLEPLRSSWPPTAQLTSAFMYGFTRQHLAREELTEFVVERWTRIVDWVIPAKGLKGDEERWMNRDEQDAMGLVLHVRHGGTVLTNVWRWAPSFTQTYERWIALLAHQPWGLRTFLTFAAAGGSHISALQLIRWVYSAVGKATDREQLWREHDNGTAAAELLARLWARSSTEIRNNPSAIREFASLCDDLIRSGVPLAAKLRSELG